ncbi:kxDL motif-containing protein 1-like [Glandiceps talaboti]
MEGQETASSSSTSQSNTQTEEVTSETPGSDTFVHLMASLVNKDDVTEIVSTQKHMLNRFEKTNEMLRSFNKLSSNHYDEKIEQFKNHTRTLLDMKRDLDIIFKRIKTLKSHVSKHYPDAICSVEENIVKMGLESEKEDGGE